MHHHFDFKGRIGRRTLAMHTLVQSVLSLAAVFVVLMLTVGDRSAPENEISPIGLLLLPAMAVSVCFGASQSTKRLHDLGRSGWVALLFLVPVVGFVFSLYLYFWEGQKGSNLYGAPESGDGLAHSG